MASPGSRISVGHDQSCIMRTRTQARAWQLPLLMVLLVLYTGAPRPASAQLVQGYYSTSCPNLESIVQSTLASAYASDTRIAASILRLHFHDCFVNGCDGSILLVDTPTFSGEQSAQPNINSARGFNVIDNIKSAVEASCPSTVSCADILTIAARDGVVLAGGPFWGVLLGRLDSFSASQAAANADIPAPFSNLNTLITVFSNLGLSQVDLVALSGAHTIGEAQCSSVNVAGNSRLYDWSENSDTTSGSGKPDPNIDASFLASLQANCPQGGNGATLNFLDTQTGTTFDNAYYQNLVAFKGLLNSDEAQYYQESFTQSIIQNYASNQGQFFNDFITAIVKMGNISPLQGSNGEIRTQCGFPNSG